MPLLQVLPRGLVPTAHKYEQAAHIQYDLGKLEIHSREIGEAALSFGYNVRMNAALAGLAAQIAGWTALTQYVDDSSRVLSGISMTSKEWVEGEPDYNPAIAEKKQKMEEVLWAEVLKTEQINNAILKAQGIGMVNILLASNAGNIYAGLAALFSSLLLGA